jgi:transposase-like protein
VLESEAPGAIVAEVCRRHDIVTSMLFRWRVQLGFGAKDAMNLVAVKAVDTPGRGTNALVLHDLLQAPDGTATVDLPNDEAGGTVTLSPAQLAMLIEGTQEYPLW